MASVTQYVGGIESNAQIKARYEAMIMMLPHVAPVEIRQALTVEMEKHADLVEKGYARINKLMEKDND
jgi:hypothetical protein